MQLHIAQKDIHITLFKSGISEPPLLIIPIWELLITPISLKMLYSRHLFKILHTNTDQAWGFLYLLSSPLSKIRS
ncbi:hypothetical protein SAMN05444285_10922 [Draconibacterium orientale]|uniref:Uncharacterized protein n=1 Tax=Draconibacterium orientale TaxID=1168034 RepID=A0A1I0D3V8_9BACT|nr:hypothetical protein SAMN05444285_10922 [Draconibacterium orientale]